MSKRHTLGISKWLPSTEDKITFEITLRPSTPDISKHLCICVYVFYRPSSNHKHNVCGLLKGVPHSPGQGGGGAVQLQCECVATDSLAHLVKGDIVERARSWQDSPHVVIHQLANLPHPGTVWHMGPHCAGLMDLHRVRLHIQRALRWSVHNVWVVCKASATNP